MSEKIEINSVEVVRQIRDQQAELLRGRSNEEIVEFFRKAGEQFRQRARSGSRAPASKPMPASPGRASQG